MHRQSERTFTLEENFRSSIILESKLSVNKKKDLIKI